MAVERLNHLYLPTASWEKTVAFWQELGFTLEEADGSSGLLRPPGGGPYLYVQEVPAGTPLDPEVYLEVTEAYAPGPPVDVQTSYTPTHWGTRVMDVRDPDGRVFHLEMKDGPEE